jgi:hypothetical protein
MYSYVMASYLTNVPKAQQYGITVWGVLTIQVGYTITVRIFL